MLVLLLVSSRVGFFLDDKLKSSGWSLGEVEGKRLSRGKEEGILKRLLYMSREEDIEDEEGRGMLYNSSIFITELTAAGLGECLLWALSGFFRGSL